MATPADRAGDTVTLEVDGVAVELSTVDGPTLLIALREQLGRVGVRSGCSIGECGACTVLVDDAAARSCQLTPADVTGRRVTTPLGLGGPLAPHPIQGAFLERAAAQCGYCIDGITMRAVALAADPAVPATVDAVAAALDDQLCRCGTHASILEAVVAGIAAVRGTPADPADATLSACRIVSPATELAAVGPGAAEAGTDAADAEAAALPALLAKASSADRWLRLGSDGRVHVASGRSEIGQGVHAAQRQLVAAQLGVDVHVVVVHPPSTGASPDEGFTAGSRSLSDGGPALAMAARALRRGMVARAADRLGLAETDLTVAASGDVVAADGRRVTVAELAAGGPIAEPIRGDDAPTWLAGPIGASTPRDDLPAKVAGLGAFVHDLAPPGLVHARAVLPPSTRARLVTTEVDHVRALPGVLAVVAEARLLVVVAETEAAAVRAASVLASRTRWEDPGPGFTGDVLEHLRALEAVAMPVRVDDGVDAALEAGQRIRASYARPYHAHGSMAPSAAVAHEDAGTLTVHVAHQGVHQLRRELAALLARDAETVVVEHVDGPGCYGHNGADDAAALAAVAALAVPGRPVRLVLAHEDEFGWEPYGPAMVTDVEAALGPDGRVGAWRLHTLTDVHMARPSGQGDRTLVAWLREDDGAPPIVPPNEGGGRNAVPIYDVGPLDVRADHVHGPVRTGSLRSLGSFHHAFAIESFMDELAEEAGADPLAFRLKHLTDPRARDVLEAAAEAAGWDAHVGPSGRGQGLALLRYHDVMGYAAMVADVDVDVDADRLRVRRLVMAVDVGTIVHLEGLRQQLEGGALQGLSRTLHEEVTVDGATGVTSRDWSRYPVLRFGEVPRLELLLLDRRGHPPLGAGEVTTPVVPAAIANAVDDALGVRLRRLPITVEAIRRRVLAMDERELARVRA